MSLKVCEFARNTTKYRSGNTASLPNDRIRIGQVPPAGSRRQRTGDQAIHPPWVELAFDASHKPVLN